MSVVFLVGCLPFFMFSASSLLCCFQLLVSSISCSISVIIYDLSGAASIWNSTVSTIAVSQLLVLYSFGAIVKITYF